jgi:hypothetical protein
VLSNILEDLYKSSPFISFHVKSLMNTFDQEQKLLMNSIFLNSE